MTLPEISLTNSKMIRKVAEIIAISDPKGYDGMRLENEAIVETTHGDPIKSKPFADWFVKLIRAHTR